MRFPPATTLVFCFAQHRLTEHARAAMAARLFDPPPPTPPTPPPAALLLAVLLDFY
jgi:hypothetical protein